MESTSPKYLPESLISLRLHKNPSASTPGSFYRTRTPESSAQGSFMEPRNSLSFPQQSQQLATRRRVVPPPGITPPQYRVMSEHQGISSPASFGSQRLSTPSPTLLSQPPRSEVQRGEYSQTITVSEPPQKIVGPAYPASARRRSFFPSSPIPTAFGAANPFGAQASHPPLTIPPAGSAAFPGVFPPLAPSQTTTQPHRPVIPVGQMAPADTTSPNTPTAGSSLRASAPAFVPLTHQQWPRTPSPSGRSLSPTSTAMTPSPYRHIARGIPATTLSRKYKLEDVGGEQNWFTHEGI
jgi:hypothetical protein